MAQSWPGPYRIARPPEQRHMRNPVKWWLITAAGIAAILCALAVTALLLAHRVPADYRPAALSRQQREHARENLERWAEQFARQTGRIGSIQHTHEPSPDEEADGFTMTITADQLNAWIAAFAEDENSPLRQAGLSGPMVRIGADRLTFMVRLEAQNRIVSVDLTPRFNRPGRLHIDLLGARLGALPVPADLVRRKRRELSKPLRRQSAEEEGSIDRSAGEGVSSHALGDAASAMAAALAGATISTEIREGFGNVRIEDIELESGRITVHVRSLLPQATD